MTAFMLAPIVAAIVIAYLAMIGVVYMRVYRNRVEGCGRCSDPYVGRCLSPESHWIPAASAGLLWPVLLPIIVAAVITDPHRSRIKAAASQRRIEELERQLQEMAR